MNADIVKSCLEVRERSEHTKHNAEIDALLPVFLLVTECECVCVGNMLARRK